MDEKIKTENLESYTIYSQNTGFVSESVGSRECWGIEIRIRSSSKEDAIERYKHYFEDQYNYSVEHGYNNMTAVLTEDEEAFESDKVVIDDTIEDLERKGIYLIAESDDDSDESDNECESDEDSEAFNIFIDNRVAGFYRADQAGCNSSWDYEDLAEYLTDIVEPEINTGEGYIFDDPQVDELNEKLCNGEITWVDFARQHCPVLGAGAMFIAEYLDENGY